MHGRPYEQLMRVNYEYAAVLEFDDVEGLKAYLNHPAHEVLGTMFFESFQEALMYDFELDSFESFDAFGSFERSHGSNKSNGSND